ncbi:MAG: hypothetical protein HWN66_19630 [Candidatus Helarchaeota archaeon]|nr:hypothetical protein [Candidatus Helarchaeota archaeon]
MVEMDLLLGKLMRFLWIAPIIGAILILIESFLNLVSVLDAGIGIGISIIVIISVILSRKDVHGTGAVLLISSFFLLLSPIGISGFDLGYLLILLGAILLTSGGLFTMGNFFIYVAIGAIVVDLIVFFVSL